MELGGIQQKLPYARLEFSKNPVYNSNQSQNPIDTFAYKNRSEVKSQKKPFDAVLYNLFKSLPKTDLHMHLSGSAPMPVLKNILKQKGLPVSEISKKTEIKDSYLSLKSFVTDYLGIVTCVKTPQQFKNVVKQISFNLAKENVRYFEVRTSLLHKHGTPDQMLQALTDGLNEAQQELKAKGFNQYSNIIVLADRSDTPANSLFHAHTAVRWSQYPGSKVVGFDIAGNEIDNRLDKHTQAINYAKLNGLHVTMHTGEAPRSVDLTSGQSIALALNLGTERLGHALHLVEHPQLMQYVIQNKIPVESCPKSNIHTNMVDSYQHHPVKQMINQGVVVTLNSDNRTMNKTNLTDQLMNMYINNIISSWSDIKKLVMNGVIASFAKPDEKQAMVNEFNQEFSKIEHTIMYKQAIDECLKP